MAVSSTARNRPFTVSSADHTGLTVSSLKRAIHIWQDILGCPVLFQDHFYGPAVADVVSIANAEIDTAFVQVPGGHKIELIEYTPGPKDRQTLHSTRTCDLGHTYVALTVDDIYAAVEALEREGWKLVGVIYTVEEGPMKGVKGCYIKDTVDAVTIEFMQGGEEGGLLLKAKL